MYLKYERIKLNWEELKDFFTLNASEINLINKFKPAKNQLGFSVQLKSFQYLGYAVKNKKYIPEEIIQHIADQLSIDASLFKDYDFDKRTGIRHLNIIRETFGFRFYNKTDHIELSQWLSKMTVIDPRRDKIAELLIWKLREEKIEVPSEKEFSRLVSHCRKTFQQEFCETVSSSLSDTTKIRMEDLLSKGKSEKSLAWLKTPAGNVGVKTLISEIAFAFCHLLGIKLMPRLKRIKYQKLHSVDKDCAKELKNLEAVLARPIRWQRIHEQYDEMVKHLTAIVENPTATDSILRRFTSYNIKHPTYKAFIELGKAIKTQFLCDYLTNTDLRIEIHEGLNIVENWNSVNTQICFGSKSEFQSNDPETQEMIVLCLHLLQNAVILSNTIMIDRVIQSENLLDVMTVKDKLSLNPLYTSNFNPYGGLNLDFDKPSFLEAA